jgi:hypothetical protein
LLTHFRSFNLPSSGSALPPRWRSRPEVVKAGAAGRRQGDRNGFCDRSVYSAAVGHRKNKFLEVLSFAYEILNGIQNPHQYLDNQWNTCETKLVDNAIILM